MSLPATFVQALKDGKVLFTTLVDMDKIIRVIEGSVSIAAGSGEVDAQSLDTGFVGAAYTRGIFSLDSGSTWQDVDGFTPYAGGRTGIATASFDGRIRIRTNSNAASPATALYKILLMHNSNMSNTVDTSFMEFFAPVSMSTTRNYQKIYLDGSTPFSITSFATGVDLDIPYNQDGSFNYIPEFMVYLVDASNNGYTIDARGAYERIYTAIDSEKLRVHIDSNGLSPVNVMMFWRFYYEHARPI